MTISKKIELIKTKCGEDSYNNTIDKLSPKEKKDLNKILQLLIDELISESELKQLVDYSIQHYAMSNSEFLEFFIDELIRQGAKIKGKKGAYLFLVGEEEWKANEKSWYGWLSKKNKDSTIENIYIKKKIEMKFNFSSELWDMAEVEQRKIIPQKVKQFLEKEPENRVKVVNEKNSISLNDIEPKVLTCTQEQQSFIEEIKELDSETIEAMLTQYSFFECREENQEFLMKVLPILYKKGLYGFLHTHLFPSLLIYNREKNYIKFKEANTLSNIGDNNYSEIYNLLKSIKNPTKEESMEITTMLISNFKRSSLSQNPTNREILLNTLIKSIKHYKEAYEDDYNYYPAINLVYMLKLLEIVFPKEKVFLDYDLEGIYSSSKPSIKEDKKRGEDFKYYASITDFEFQILLNHKDKKELKTELEDILFETAPDKFFLERTVKQMNWFKSLIERFGNPKLYDNRVKTVLQSINFVIKEIEEAISFL